jgi:hypothetical protein
MIGAGLFKSNSEKLAARLESLEAEALAQEATAAESRRAAAEADAKAAEALADGDLDVTAWRKRRAAAEAKASEADAALKAARDAAEIVRGRLEETRSAELLASLRGRYAAVQSHAPGALQDALVTGRAFSEAYGRLEGLRSEEASVIWQLRQAGDRETQVCGVPLVESALSDALGHAEGRQSQRILIPFWPRTTP